MRYNRLFGYLTSITVTVLASGHALAQEQAIEEVIVTATKRSQNIQDVPMTVTAFSAEQIRQANIQNATDVALLTPSLVVATVNQPFSSSLRVRGIGTAQNDPALEPSVGIFVDDVYLNRTGLGMSDLTDIQRVEVLNGPQGTLYGKNTNAGAVSVFTKRPNAEEFEGYIEATKGDYDLQRYTLAASGPITDSLAFRVSGNIHKRDGYFDNGGTGGDLGNADDSNIMGKLLYQPTEDLSVLVNASYVDRDNTCCAADAVLGQQANQILNSMGIPDKNDPYDFEIAVDVPSAFKNEVTSISMVADYSSAWGELKTITAWNQSEGSAGYDLDRSMLDVMYVDGASESEFFSQEVRFASEVGDLIDYQIGLFYFNSEQNQGDGEPSFFLTLPPIPSSPLKAKGTIANEHTLETETFALFGQATWDITDRWHLTGGLRASREEKDAELFSENNSVVTIGNNPVTPASRAFLANMLGVPVAQVDMMIMGLTGNMNQILNGSSTPIDASLSRQSDSVDWLVDLSYDLGENVMSFARFATGTKSGGFNTVGGLPNQREFDDETTLSYELGVKATLLDSRLLVNASAFLSQVEDWQFQRQTDLGTQVGNEAEVEVRGIDLFVQAKPLPNLNLGFGMMYLDKAEITDGVNKGNPLAIAPEYSANLNATLFLPMPVGVAYLRGDYSYMDDHFTTNAVGQPRPQDIQDRETLNATLGWRTERWNLSLWGKNLTDDEYAGFTGATSPITGASPYFLTPPRTYGATLRYEI